MQHVYKTYMFARRAHKLMHEKTTFSKENNHRGAPRPCGARPKAAPLCSLQNVVFLHMSVCALRANMYVWYTFCIIIRIYCIIPSTVWMLPRFDEWNLRIS